LEALIVSKQRRQLIYGELAVAVAVRRCPQLGNAVTGKRIFSFCCHHRYELLLGQRAVSVIIER
jgi:hypothetical protein